MNQQRALVFVRNCIAHDCNTIPSTIVIDWKKHLVSFALGIGDEGKIDGPSYMSISRMRRFNRVIVFELELETVVAFEPR